MLSLISLQLPGINPRLFPIPLSRRSLRIQSNLTCILSLLSTEVRLITVYDLRRRRLRQRLLPHGEHLSMTVVRR